MRAWIDKSSFVVGEEFALHIECSADEIPTGAIENLSTDIFRLDVARNYLALGFGTKPEQKGNQLTVRVVLPEGIKPGIHLVTGTSITHLGGSIITHTLQFRFDPIFFEIRTHAHTQATPDALLQQISEMKSKRENFVKTPILTASAKASNVKIEEFYVHIFAVGCLLHSMQQMAGYSIAPLQRGLSHKRLHAIVNSTLGDDGFGPLEFSNDMESQFERNTPTLVVRYSTVKAISAEDALDHCRSHASLIFQILGRERGQIPREFAGVASKRGALSRWHFFELPGYRGNLVSDFDPASLAEKIDRVLPKLETDPFARLLTRSYAEATGETDFGFRLLRFWTILELAADRAITKDGTPLLHPDGTAILNKNGKVETQGSKHGRVYAYVFAHGIPTTVASYHDRDPVGETIIIAGDASNPNYQSGVRLISLWEMVKAAYAIRNAVAHEGYFDTLKASQGDSYERLAAQMVTSNRPDILDFVRNLAQQVLWREA